MDLIRRCVVVVWFLRIISTEIQSNAQTVSSARSLDAILQDYAYRAFVYPRTGEVYSASVPSNLSGISLSVVRLRSGSLRMRGLYSFKEFDIPQGVIAVPYVIRLALVYQNLGNWSSVYYTVPGYTFLTPVIGLLAYNASNISATNLPELDLVLPSTNPISIKFAGLSLLSDEIDVRCVHFHKDGSYTLGDLISGERCTVRGQGHFSVAVNSTDLAPSPSPSQSAPPPPYQPPPAAKKWIENHVWKIVVGVACGSLAVILLLFLILWLLRYRRGRKMRNMLKRSESGEELSRQRIGNVQLPVANMVRTRPVLEN